MGYERRLVERVFKVDLTFVVCDNCGKLEEVDHSRGHEGAEPTGWIFRRWSTGVEVEKRHYSISVCSLECENPAIAKVTANVEICETSNKA